MTIVATFLFGVGLFASVSPDLSASAIVAIIQVVICIYSLMLGLGTTQSKVKNFHVIILMIAVLLIVPYISLKEVTFETWNERSYDSENEEKKAEAIIWEELKLKDQIPNVKFKKCIVKTNTSKHLIIYVYGSSKKQFEEYVEECKNNGYTVEPNLEESGFSAHNTEGYKLEVDIQDKRMDINLSAPIEMQTIQWPAYGLANKLPTPKSLTGKITYDNSDRFEAYIGDTSKEYFEEYIDQCKGKGFTVDYARYGNRFSAENKAEAHLSVRYEGAGIMYIEIYDFS